MSVELIGLIGLCVLIVTIFAGIYIGAAMAIVGFVGTWVIVGPLPALSNLAIVPFGILRNHTFAVLPLFILMSEYISMAGIGRDAYIVARAWLGHVRGGLAMATIGGCALFAATSGSSTACAVVMGKISFPEMLKNKYSRALASGTIAAGGTVGVMIPPSIPFVVYGILTGTSIGKLFIAGILPGITQVLFYGITIYILCRINPALGPASPKLPLKQQVTSTYLAWPVIVIFLVIIGGIYLGIFTGSEAAAVGAFGALTLGLARSDIKGAGIWQGLKNTLRIAGMSMLLLSTAFILNSFMAMSRLPFVAANYLASLELNRLFILAAILILYIILGCFFEMAAVMILTLPILFPTIIALGFDPVWYGVLMCRMAEMAFITPPFGLNLFVLNGSLNIPMNDLFKGVIPFIIADLCHTALLVTVPQLSLFLPSVMR